METGQTGFLSLQAKTYREIMGYSKSDILRLKEAVLLSDVVSAHVTLRPQGGRLVGKCPFHNETNASLCVNDEEGFFYCFGCQATGDVLDFVSRVNGFGFRESVTHLCALAGLELQDDGPAEDGERARCLEALSEAALLFSGAYFGSEGEAYLSGRGVGRSSVDDFGIGWCGRGLPFLHPLAERFGWPVLERAGLVRVAEKSRYSQFSGRVVFPIRDISGRVVSFGGRLVGAGEPKYVNGPETEVFSKKEHLFGLAGAKAAIMSSGKGILTEGYMDVVSMKAGGFANTVGVLGTSVTAGQCRKVGAFCKTLLMLFDGDEAGRKAAFRAVVKAMEAGRKCSVALLPEGEDADSMVRSDPDGLVRIMDGAIDDMGYFCSYLDKACPHPSDMLKVVRDALSAVSGDLAGYYAKRISDLTGLAVDGIMPKSESPFQSAVSTKVSGQERNVMSFLYRNPGYAGRMKEDGFGKVVVSSSGKAFWERLDERFQDNPMDYLVTGEEKSMYARSRLSKSGQPDPEIEYREMLVILGESERERAFAEMSRKIREAEERGDFEEALRLASNGEAHVSF